MNPKEKEDPKDNPREGVQTPPPPQVIDPSKPPGKGNHETWRKEDKEHGDTRQSGRGKRKPKESS